MFGTSGVALRVGALSGQSLPPFLCCRMGDSLGC